MKKDIVAKCLFLMRFQAACSGINLDNQNLVYSSSRIDNPEFVDLLLGNSNSKSNYKKSNIKYPSDIQFTNMNIYQTSVSSPKVYEFKNGKTKCISNPKQPLRDYLIQKLMAIQTLKEQIDFRDEVKTRFNNN